MPARKILWIPCFLLGVAAATALATGAGLLLYNDQGLVRAGLVLAAVNLGSVGVGVIGAGSRESDGDPHTGRWWLGFLVALLGAAAFAVAWEAMGAFSAAPGAQGVGLALTSALPAYCAAGTWARLRGLELLVTAGTQRQTALGTGAGVATGAALVAVFLGRPVWAVTSFLGAMVLGSSGARLHVWLLDRLPRLSRSVRDSDHPGRRFEEWRTLVPESRSRVVVEDGRTVVVDPPPPGDWREGVAATLHGGHPVLFVGAGSWFAADDTAWKIYEADDGVRKLVAEGFGWGGDALAGTPVPEGEGCVVVAEAAAARFIRPSALRLAGVRRVWIGGAPGAVPAAIPMEAWEAGHGLKRFRSAVAGVPGPPHVGARADELWCIDFGGEPPDAIPGMVAAPLPRDWATAVEVVPRAGPNVPDGPPRHPEETGGGRP